jgi:hypothetical protein
MFAIADVLIPGVVRADVHFIVAHIALVAMHRPGYLR